MKRCITLGALVAALALSACENNRTFGNADLAPHDFGNSVRANIAVESVNPNASATNEPPAAQGERTAIAQQRYATGKTIPPADPELLTGGTASSSGSGTGAGMGMGGATGGK